MKNASPWFGWLYLMGLNLSHRQIAQELGLNQNDVQDMTRTLRQGVVDRSVTPQRSGTVEMDEIYIVAGHKGQSELVKKTDEWRENDD